jgi:hypothetical protein
MEKPKYTFEEKRKSFENENYVLLTEKYIDSHQMLQYICANGHKHHITWGNWNNGHRCPFCYKQPRKYEINEYSFEKMSPEAAYWLGFIAADGNIRTKKNHEGTIKGISFHLSKKDKNHLEKFKLFIKSNHPIYNDKNKPMIVFAVYSKQMYNDLVKWGIKERKSWSLSSHIELIPDEYKSYFICGLVDGDGCFTISKRGNTTNKNVLIMSNIATLEDIRRYLEKYDIIDKKIHSTVSKNLFLLSIGKRNEILSFFNLYESCPVHLDRKYEKVQIIKRALKNVKRGILDWYPI